MVLAEMQLLRLSAGKLGDVEGCLPLALLAFHGTGLAIDPIPTQILTIGEFRVN